MSFLEFQPLVEGPVTRPRYFDPYTLKDYLYGPAQRVGTVRKYKGNTNVEGDYTVPRLTAEELLKQATAKTKFVESTGKYNRLGGDEGGGGGFRMPGLKGVGVFASDGAPEVIEEEVEEKVDVDVPKADSDGETGTDLREDVYRSNQEMIDKILGRADQYVQQGIAEREAEALRDLRRYALQGEIAQEGRRELTRRKIQEANINAWRDLNRARIEAGSKAAVAVGLGAYAASKPDPNLMAALSSATNVGMGGRQAPRPPAITIATKL